MKVQLTKDTFDKLSAELEELKSVRKPEITELLKKAVAEGDISENSEFDAAHDELGKVDGRIADIKDKLSKAEIVEYVSTSTSNEVILGSKVTVEDSESGAKQDYLIVLPDDVDVAEGKISAESPVGIALMSKTVGETVKVKTPGGEREYRVVEIN